MVEEEGMRWYQNAVINGRAMPAQRERDTSQLRWAELLAPLVNPDGDGRLFLDLGCNAGFYCREAAALGYRTLGIDKEPEFIEQARLWEREEPAGVRIRQADMREFEIPACHTALLASVHYWLEDAELDDLLARLRERSLFLIVQGKHRGPSTIHPDRLQLLKRVWGDWFIVDQTRTRKHYAVLLRSPALFEAETGELYSTRLAIATEQEREFFTTFERFVRLALEGKPFDHSQTGFAEYLRKQRLRYRDFLMWAYVRLVEDICRNGVQEPLIAYRDTHQVRNGHHRLVIARVLGIKHLICRAA